MCLYKRKESKWKLTNESGRRSYKRSLCYSCNSLKSEITSIHNKINKGKCKKIKNIKEDYLNRNEL